MVTPVERGLDEPVEVTGTVTATVTDPLPVSGTFYQVTQPVSIASMPTTPVTGTFYQATQPVSGTFYQATQPVSIASLPVAPEDNKAVVVYEDGNYAYICRASEGTSVSAASWQVKKIDMSSGVVLKYADGNDSYDNLATSLAVVSALSYS